LVLEYAAVGDLSKFIKNAKKLKMYVPETEVVRIFKGITLGIQELHRNKIVHRDIKPANIMIMKDKTIKICDMGVSRKVCNSN